MTYFGGLIWPLFLLISLFAWREVISLVRALSKRQCDFLSDGDMFSKKFTEAEREVLRAQRRETQLITARARADKSFIYVVNPPEIPRVAFGSGMERITLPMSGPGLSSFMRKIQGEVRDFPGPFEYVETKQALDKKYPSAYGYSAFVSKLPRLPPTEISRFPPIGAYNAEPPKKIKQAARPFNIGTKRVQIKKLVTPCPADYAVDKRPASLKICSAFGSRRIIWPAVAVICAPVNVAKCYKCNKTPVGDYYHQFQLNLDMCRPCMNKQLKLLKRCSTDLFYRARMRNELSQYQPVRYCDFFHDHQGTTAAIQHMTKSTLRYKIKTENYIYMFKKR